MPVIEILKYEQEQLSKIAEISYDITYPILSFDTIASYISVTTRKSPSEYALSIFNLSGSKLGEIIYYSPIISAFLSSEYLIVGNYTTIEMRTIDLSLIDSYDIGYPISKVLRLTYPYFLVYRAGSLELYKFENTISKLSSVAINIRSMTNLTNNYIACDTINKELLIYRFNGSSLEFITKATLTGYISDMASIDGQLIAVTTHDGNLHLYNFDGQTLTLLKTENIGIHAAGVTIFEKKEEVIDI
ncbi:MAG: hypothetical protein LWW95_08380 [Candidatus Desulfofervidus auxilii]|nr:hypothetical protein [Candidatus Desulfofervidus auxilii]